MSLHQETTGAVFAPETVGAINRAYRSALDVLSVSPSLKSGMDDQVARVELAKEMMRLAKQGESDEGMLRERALFHLVLMQQPAS
jgi:hypothetical protein